MQATIETLALIRAADDATVNANKSGVTAVLALVRENLNEKFPHGVAVELANILKDGKVTPASAKRYAELCVMACKAIALQASLASSKAKPSEKAAAKAASVDASLTELAGMASMGKVRDWSKANGPKAKAPAPAADAPAADAPAADAPAADAPAADAPAAPNLEALGQMREIRECLAMINAGQVTPGEALATIATIAGIQLATPAPTPAPAGKAGTNGRGKTPKAV